MRRGLQAPDYLVVEGPIGVGKTTLVQRLAESFGCDPLLEEAEYNPFLERFYHNRRQAALPTQLFFLFQRSRQLQDLRQSDLFRERLVSDFMMDKDRLFARLNLDEEEFGLYEQVYSQLSLDAPRPDLVVYLQAPVDVLMRRIRRRGRKSERKLDYEYLNQLCDSYAKFFYYYDRSPLLIVNASEINPVDNEADYRLLLEQICTVRSGKHYFNPAPVMS